MNNLNIFKKMYEVLLFKQRFPGNLENPKALLFSQMIKYETFKNLSFHEKFDLYVSFFLINSTSYKTTKQDNIIVQQWLNKAHTVETQKDVKNKSIKNVGEKK